MAVPRTTISLASGAADDEGTIELPEHGELTFLPGVAPELGGCPPVDPRVERIGEMLVEYDVA
ncbi:MAG: hypothetical protein ACRDL8_17845, partial [Solirubrobacteraceae bacterium]